MSTQEQRLLGPLAMRYAAMILLVVAPAAHAQLNVTVTALGTRDATTSQLGQLATLQQSPIGVAECENATITFQFTGVDTTRTQLQFWWGTDCMTATNRTTTTTSACNDLPAETSINMMPTLTNITFPVSSILGVQCSSGGEGVQTTYVLALTNAGDPVSTNQIKSFPLAYDFQPPSVPTGLGDGAGDPSAAMSWVASSGATTNTVRYEVYVDPTGCEGGMQTANAFMAGAAVPDGLTPHSTTSSPSVSINFGDYGTPLGGYVAVAVRAIDRGGNASVLSNVACAQHVDVQTWWETYCARSPQPAACASTGCSVHGAPNGTQATLIAPLVLGALLVARRRRR
jgi:MYXO-CTERM domain-containing protein